jgi:hypothetical protein
VPLGPPLAGAVPSPFRGPTAGTGAPRQAAGHLDLGLVPFGAPLDASTRVQPAPDCPPQMGYGTPDHGIGSPAAGSGREPDLHDRSDIFRGFRCRIPLRSTIRIVGDICPKLARHRPKTSSMAAIPALGWPSLAPVGGRHTEGSDRCGDGRVHRRCPVGACAAGRLRSGRHAWESGRLRST